MLQGYLFRRRGPLVTRDPTSVAAAIRRDRGRLQTCVHDTVACARMETRGCSHLSIRYHLCCPTAAARVLAIYGRPTTEADSRKLDGRRKNPRTVTGTNKRRGKTPSNGTAWVPDPAEAAKDGHPRGHPGRIRPRPGLAPASVALTRIMVS
jgi:hypothetical protein